MFPQAIRSRKIAVPARRGESAHSVVRKAQFLAGRNLSERTVTIYDGWQDFSHLRPAIRMESAFSSLVRMGPLAINRRAALEAGALSTMGLAWSDLLRAGEQAGTTQIPGFGVARSCILIFQFGGPSQQDLWDLKPQAPVEVRGEFRPAATNVPGTQISEQLPHLRKVADKFTLVRSMRHTDFEHGSASYTALTGQPHPLPGTNTPARPEDFPTLGSVVTLKKKVAAPVPEAVVLGPVMHQGNRPPMAGQNGGFLGRGLDPFRIAEDPSRSDFRVAGLEAKAEVSADRLVGRRTLLEQYNRSVSHLQRKGVVESMNRLQRRAFGLLSSTQSQRAFDLAREPTAIRDRYGRHRFGQTLILARRLAEAGVPLIQVNWSKLNADQWDTHKQNYKTLRKLLPPFDQGVAALLADLDSRGMLDTTMVICLGEFGRTPKMNKQAGRDHWPDCYSVLVAGGGFHRGRVIGATDAIAAYPTTDPIAPWDLAATLFHNLGVPPHIDIYDRLRRPFRISSGRVIRDLIEA